MTTAINTVTATEAKNRFGSMLRKAYADAEHVIIERDGIAVAALIPIQDYEQLTDSDELADQAKASATRDRIKAFLAKIESQVPDYPEEQVEADVRNAIRAVRDANKGK